MDKPTKSIGKGLKQVKESEEESDEEENLEDY